MVHRQTEAVAQHLKPLGWKYITLDDCWGGERLANGSYSWDPVRFPSGMPALAAFVKSRGLELGLYMAAGNQTCNQGGRPYQIPGSFGRYTEDAATLVGWGVTYIKLDWCGSFPPLAQGSPEEMRLKPRMFAEFSEVIPVVVVLNMPASLPSVLARSRNCAGRRSTGQARPCTSPARRRFATGRITSTLLSSMPANGRPRP